MKFCLILMLVGAAASASTVTNTATTPFCTQTTAGAAQCSYTDPGGATYLAQASFALQVPAVGYTFNGAYHLKAYSELDFSGGDGTALTIPGTGSGSVAKAQWSDVVTFDAKSSFTGTVVVTHHLTATLSLFASPSLSFVGNELLAGFSMNGTSGSCNGAFYSGGLPSSFYTLSVNVDILSSPPCPVTVTPGLFQMTYSAYLMASSGTGIPGFNQKGDRAKVDASNSMGLMDIRFIDQNGNDVSDQFTATTESGAVLPIGNSPLSDVPEPQTSWLILFGVGLGAGVAARIRGKAAQRLR